MPSGQQDIAIRGIEAYNRGDLEALFELVTDDAEFVIPDGMANAGTYRGREGFESMIADWNEAWEVFRIEFDEPIEDGETVIVPITQYGRGRGSGVEIQMSGAHLLRFRGGLLHRWRLCESREEALRQAQSG